jgi:electron transport complex protein RnfC
LEVEPLLEMVEVAGVVGLGRSALPLYLELRRFAAADRPVLVLDLAETEPYGFPLAAFMKRFGTDVMEGAAIVAKIVGASDAMVVATRNSGTRSSGIRRLSRRFGFSLTMAPRLFPGNLDSFLRRKSVHASNALNPDHDVMILDPNTALAVFEAVVRHKPQIDRIVSVTGDLVAKPALLRVRLGTPVIEVLEECEGITATPDRIVLGQGAISGFEIDNVQQPITKTTGTIAVLSREAAGQREETFCIGCGLCARACPVHLDPALLFHLLGRGLEKRAAAMGLSECVECGACSFVCPSRIPLAQRLRRPSGRSAG